MYVSFYNKLKGWLTLYALLISLISLLSIGEADKVIESVCYSALISLFPSLLFYYPIACMYQRKSDKKRTQR